MSKPTPKAPTQNLDSICAAIGRVMISGEPSSEIIVVSREQFKDTTADIRQSSVVRFDPVVIRISSAPDSSSYNAPVTIGHLVSAATIAAAAANGAYAYRINVKKQTGILSNLNNEISGTYDQLLVGTSQVTGDYHYGLENANAKLVASNDNKPIFETSTMPISQATTTVLYNAAFDFNQLRAMASNVSADVTLDMSVEVETIFSYGTVPNNNNVQERKPVASARKFV